MRRKKTRSIVIIGRKWFDKVNGNTYHTAEIIINGVPVHKTLFAYGYGDSYIQSARKWLKENKYLKGIEEHPHCSLWVYCRNSGINLVYYSFNCLKCEL